MAKNTKLSRDPVKLVRDKAKASYPEVTHCAICGSTEDLELHHFHSLTNLLEKWAKDNGINLTSDEEVKAVREHFIASHHRELYELVVTLCNKHHVALHLVYGSKPLKGTEQKQANWVEKQRIKFNERMVKISGET